MQHSCYYTLSFNCVQRKTTISHPDSHQTDFLKFASFIKPIGWQHKLWTTTLCITSGWSSNCHPVIQSIDSTLEKLLSRWHWVVNTRNKLQSLSNFFVFLLHILRCPQASSFSSVCIPVELHLKAQSVLWLLECTSVLRTPSVCLSVCVEYLFVIADLVH